MKKRIRGLGLMDEGIMRRDFGARHSVCQREVKKEKGFATSLLVVCRVSQARKDGPIVSR